MSKIIGFAVILCGLLILIKAQDASTALYRGYRAGYSDGYMAGYRDGSEGREKNHQIHSEYQKADRAYRAEFGSLEDYKNGYRRGFEKGYADGFEKREFRPEMPAELQKSVGGSGETSEEANKGTKTSNESDTGENPVKTSEDEPTIIIPADTELVIELEQDLSTERNKAGDKFTA
ncbi:MAG: hypothetical protein ACK419_06890, partial [Pyrinomonadaceae bacterium]